MSFLTFFDFVKCIFLHNTKFFDIFRPSKKWTSFLVLKRFTFHLLSSFYRLNRLKPTNPKAARTPLAIQVIKRIVLRFSKRGIMVKETQKREKKRMVKRERRVNFAFEDFEWDFSKDVLGISFFLLYIAL